jgi:hypothetical protein
MANDGRWYPPESAPPPVPMAPGPAYDPRFAPAGPWPAGPYAGLPPRATNGLAVASLVLGILWVYWVGSLLALVFGYVALIQIRERNQGGHGLAVAGVVLGWIGTGIGLFTVVTALIVALGGST